MPSRRAQRILWSWAFAAVAWFAALGAAGAAVIYGIDQDAIYQIDTVSGASSPIVVFNPAFTWIAAEAINSSGTIYFLDGSSNNANLWSYNTLTPGVQPVLIGTTGTSDYVPRLAVGPTGVLYGMSVNNVLYTINTSTGASTTLGTIGGLPNGLGGDIAFGPGGALYLADGSSMYTIPTTTGSATLVGSLSVPTVTGLAFDPSDNAYTSDVNGNIYKITGLPGTPVSSGTPWTVVSLVGSTFGDLASEPLATGPALYVSKSDNGPWTVGQTGAQYTISVGNAGSTATSGTVTVTDTLPGNLTANGTPSGTGWSCSVSGGTRITCTSTVAIAAGGTAGVISVPVNVGTGTLGTINNTVLGYGGGDPVHGTSGSPTSYTRTTTVKNPSLSVKKTDNSPWAVGQSGATYTITVTNNGTGATSGTITISDPLPTGITIATGFTTPTGWTCTATTGSSSFSCTSNSGTSLAASGGAQAFTLPVSIGSSAPNSIVNVVSAYGGGDPSHGTSGTATTGTDTASLGPVPNLTVTKTTDKTAWPLGSNVGKYTLTIANTGGAATSGTITVTDTLPNGLTANGTPGGGGFNCTVTGGTQITCTSTNSLNTNQNAQINVAVNVAVGTASSVNNTAYAYGGGDPSHTQTNPASGSNTQTIQLPNLTMAKTDNGPWTVNQGGAKYTLTVTNTGAGPTLGTVTVQDTLPTGLTANGTPGGGGFTCTVSGGTQISCTSTNALNANQNTQINVTVNVNSGVPYSVTNTASTYGAGDPVHTSIGTAATGSDTTSINNIPGLAIVKTDNSGTSGWTIGQSGAKYTLTVKNVGTGATSGTITVSDTLPTGLTANGNPTGTGWTCTGTGTATISCTSTTSIAVGGSSAITVPVTLGSNAPTGTNSITNTGSAYGGGDPVYSNAGNATTSSDSTSVHPAAAPSLTVTKTDNGGSSGWTIAQSGAQYTVTVGNSGAAATSGTITVIDTLPTGLTDNGTPTGTGWTCSVTGGDQFTCTSTTVIAAGGTGNAVSVPVKIGDSTPTGTNSITNTAGAYGGGDPAHTSAGTEATGSDSTTVGYAATTFVMGPDQNPAATGSYDGVVATNNNDDFTAVSIQRGGNPQVNSSGAGVPLSVTLSSSTAPCIAHTFLVQTGGGQAFSLTATAPNGWLVGLYSNATCTTALGGATVGATSTGTLGNLDDTSGSVEVYTQYTSSSAITVTPFARYDAPLLAFITALPTSSNTTHDELYYGYVSLLKTQTILHSTCVGGTGLCPGSTISYSIVYSNAMPSGYTSSEGSLTPRPFPYGLSLVLDEDGINNGSWGLHGGMTAAPADTTSGTTFTYTKNGVSTANPVGATQFNATIGGGSYGGLQAGASGTITFVVIVN